MPLRQAPRKKPIGKEGNIAEDNLNPSDRSEEKDKSEEKDNIDALDGARDQVEEDEINSEHEGDKVNDEDETWSYNAEGEWEKSTNLLKEQILQLTKRTEELQEAMDGSKTKRGTNVVMSHNIEPCTKLVEAGSTFMYIDI